MDRYFKNTPLVIGGLFLLIAILFFYAAPYVLQYAEEDFDIVFIEEAYAGKNPPPQGPVEIRFYCNGQENTCVWTFEPLSTRREFGGVMIKLDEFFVMERGLFIPDDIDVFDAEKGGDPDFQYLGHGIYSYLVRG